MDVAVRRAGSRLSEPELAAWRGMLRAHAALIKTLDAELEHAHGLPLSSYEVMVALDDAPGRRMRMCDLAASVLLSRSGITRLVDRLERDGFVARDPCTQDARGAFAVLTAAGARKLLAARATHIDGVRRHFLSRLSADELEALGELLSRLDDPVGAGGEVAGSA
jgi:DNA-binding MarR family transcriptional regulator